MTGGSVLAHLGLLAIAIILPSFWSHDEPVREVMTISLGGGAPGPRTGGMAAIGGREVQEVAPPEPPKPVAPPPPPEPPKMSYAIEPKPKPKTETKKKAPEESPVPPKPTIGPEVVAGSTPIDTGVKGTGFGLSSSGGISGPVSLDVVDFCCPEYLEQVVNRIYSNWKQDQGRKGASVVSFRIRRDGTVEEVMIDKPSGYYPLDAAAQRAVNNTRLPQLPQAFTNPTLTVQLTFTYMR
jgi:TonB family protein